MNRFDGSSIFIRKSSVFFVIKKNSNEYISKKFITFDRTMHILYCIVIKVCHLLNAQVKVRLILFNFPSSLFAISIVVIFAKKKKKKKKE